MNELVSCDQWIYETLTGDTTLAGLVATAWAAAQAPPIVPAPASRPDRWVFSGVAPQGTLTPYIVFHCLSAPDVLGGFATRVMTKPLYQVKVIGKGSSFLALAAIAGQLDADLCGADVNTTVAGVTVQGVYRERAISYPELVDNVRFNHLGGLYRLIASGAGG